MSERLSGCIISFNEEDRIQACIESLSFCDEIVVVDSHSTDRTREIAAELGARVIQHDWPGHVAQKNYATQQAQYDWILSLDCDERITPELRAEIVALKDRGFPGCTGWKMRRLSYYLGAWVRYGTWRPDWNLRLFNRCHACWGGNDPHDRVEMNQRPGVLRGNIEHYPYRSLAEHLRTMDAYTTTMAQGMHARGKRGSVWHVVLHPWARFIKYYLVKCGFLDGWRGLVMAYLAAQYVRTKYIKLLILQRVGDKTD